ncbi:MAG: MotA/TolQ/ExbB proton channel family protein [Desulfuromonadales bacterium]|nr:MotA/TolQ/ExbB proton channel family protein [Desulfuromonadales bacterium]
MTLPTFINLESLATGKWILLTLAGLSIWIWVLAVVTMINLHLAKKKSAGGLFDEHSCYCQRLRNSRLRKRVRQHLTKVHGEILLKRTAGHVGTILILSSIAPLLGLLGTIEGMIDNFQVIAQIGIADSSQLTAGISKALVTTQGGLLVAIPGLLVGGVLYRKMRKLRNALVLASTNVMGDLP